MDWKIGLSSRSLKFLSKNAVLKEEIFGCVEAAIRKFQGSNTNVDIRKMKGVWSGFYRIRKGDVRIIAEFNFERQSVFVEIIDWRGRAYKK